MRIITIPPDKATFAVGRAYKGVEPVDISESQTFLEWLEELASITPEFGKGIRAAKRMRRLTAKIDEAEKTSPPTLAIEDDDWQDMKKRLESPDFAYAPAKNSAVLPFMEAFVDATEQKGPA